MSLHSPPCKELRNASGCELRRNRTISKRKLPRESHWHETPLPASDGSAAVPAVRRRPKKTVGARAPTVVHQPLFRASNRLLEVTLHRHPVLARPRRLAMDVTSAVAPQIEQRDVVVLVREVRALDRDLPQVGGRTPRHARVVDRVAVDEVRRR